MIGNDGSDGPGDGLGRMEAAWFALISRLRGLETVFVPKSEAD